jgi:hypothetical protein
VHCPQYNGAIEHGIGELKRDLQHQLAPGTQWRPEYACSFVRFLVHKHNCQWRRRLHGLTATQAYAQMPRLFWNQAERHHLFAWIGARARRILSAMEHPTHRDLRFAWRRAVESWLRGQGLIEVSIHNKTVTPFS